MGNLDLDLECFGFEISRFWSKIRRDLLWCVPRRGVFFFLTCPGQTKDTFRYFLKMKETRTEISRRSVQVSRRNVCSGPIWWPKKISGFWYHIWYFLTYFQRASTSQMQVEWQMCKPRQNIQIATYFFRILLLTGTYFIRVVCTRFAYAPYGASEVEQSKVRSSAVTPKGKWVSQNWA